MIANGIDPIDLEVLRSRLEAVGEQACRTIEQTAVSPAITESKDYSATLMDADGGLIIGSGPVIYHYGAAAHAVRSTIARYGAEQIRPGDVFLANDPHNGGGLHPQDVMLQQPIFIGDRLVAWVGASAHLMDMGGMVIGSFAPEATECFQEAFRIPSVRLFRAGAEVTEVWDLLRTNIRMSELVEMDLRGLVAGAHLASERIAQVVEQTGFDAFIASLAAIRDLSEMEMRRRIAGDRRWHLPSDVVDGISHGILQNPLCADGGRRPDDLRFRRRLAAMQALLQLEAAYHRGGAGGDAGEPDRTRSAVQ